MIAKTVKKRTRLFHLDSLVNVTTRLPARLNKRLNAYCDKTEGKKESVIARALTSHLDSAEASL